MRSVLLAVIGSDETPMHPAQNCALRGNRLLPVYEQFLQDAHRTAKLLSHANIVPQAVASYHWLITCASNLTIKSTMNMVTSRSFSSFNRSYFLHFLCNLCCILWLIHNFHMFQVAVYDFFLGVKKLFSLAASLQF